MFTSPAAPVSVLEYKQVVDSRSQINSGHFWCIHLICFSCLIKVPHLNTPPHLPLDHPNSLSRRTVTETRTDGHISTLQIIMHLLIGLERFEDFFYRRMITFLLASLVITFLRVLLTWYSLLGPLLGTLGLSFAEFWNFHINRHNFVHRCGTSGSMRACHAAGPGSIPGRDNFPGWGFFGVFPTPVRQMPGSFRPTRSPNIIWPS